MPGVKSAIVVGAGLLGRLIALECSSIGIDVEIFDASAASLDGAGSCSHAAAGMLAPTSELEIAEPLIYELGRNSLQLWTDIIDRLDEMVFFQKSGTIVVADQNARSQLLHFLSRVATKKAADRASIALIDRAEIKTLEPYLAEKFDTALFIPNEGQIDNRRALIALGKTLINRGINWRQARIEHVRPGSVIVNGQKRGADVIVDARGLGAHNDLPALRGVRGEIVEVEAPEVVLHRPVRVLHSRWPVYLVPRPDNRFLIGATSIETDDARPVTVESALELLAAACRVHHGFLSATITDMRSGLRPAFPDNTPRIYAEPGLIRINGLYRHGFLTGPRLAQLALAHIQDTTFSTNAALSPALAGIFAGG